MNDKSKNINYNINNKYNGGRISRKEVFQILQDIEKEEKHERGVDMPEVWQGTCTVGSRM